MKQSSPGRRGMGKAFQVERTTCLKATKQKTSWYIHSMINSLISDFKIQGGSGLLWSTKELGFTL